MKTTRSYEKEAIRQTDTYREMSESGRYDLTDPIIESAVCQYAWLDEKIEECRRILDTEGLMAEGLHGMKQNPAQGSLKAYMQMQKLVMDQLKQLTSTAPKKNDELDEFLGVV